MACTRYLQAKGLVQIFHFIAVCTMYQVQALNLNMVRFCYEVKIKLQPFTFVYELKVIKFKFILHVHVNRFKS